MSQRKTTQEKSKFSKLRLRSNTNKSNKLCSPHPREKISSYFSSVCNETDTTTSNAEDLSETIPTYNYKGPIEKVCSNGSSELNYISDTPDDEISDFVIPKVLKVTKSFETKTKSDVKKCVKSTNNKTQFVTNTKINILHNSDTNQEHLQLAIALSKSVSDLEHPPDAESSVNVFPSTQQKIAEIKQTLDQFGFKSDKASVPTSNLKTNLKQPKGKKYKYITPTLFLRTEEQRTKLIENKVSQIINNISIYNETVDKKQKNLSGNFTDEIYNNNKPRSFVLRDYYNEDSVLFNKNSLCVTDMKRNLFYNNIISPDTEIKAGVLLKNWETIPGREKTPPLEEQFKKADTSKNDLQIPTEPSMSPELFSDSDETDITTQIHNSRKEYLNSTNNSVTQINKDKDVESDSSTKSLSLLDISSKHCSLPSLSPFQDVDKPLIKRQSNILKQNDGNSSSLSPFEIVEEHKLKSPKKKTTPKKNSPSGKKYVVTPKGRKIISPILPRKQSPCKKTLFTDEICHYESFSDDKIECFDLTHSSDDDISNKESVNKNTSYTITQLLNELSPSKRNVESSSSYDTQASIQTIKLNLSGLIEPVNVDEDFSPEFDCLNTSNNQKFYDTFNNSLLSGHDDNKTETFNNSVSKKRNSSLWRRSFSENIINDKELQTTNKCIKFKDKELSRSLDEIEFIEQQECSYLKNDLLSLSQSSSMSITPISDEELNYSSNSLFRKKIFNDEVSSDDSDENESICNEEDPKDFSTPAARRLKETCLEESFIEGPKPEIIIKTTDITPKGNYSDMDTPERNLELDKYGLKPMKRSKGVKILHYIYDSMHPFVESVSSDDENLKTTKRRKTITDHENIQQNASEIAESEKIEDMIFERTQSSKIHSCRIPLHIAWHNLLTSSKELQENILLYEPVQIEDIRTKFKSLGFKFHIQDIIAFLDKKCITTRNPQKYHRKKKKA